MYEISDPTHPRYGNIGLSGNRANFLIFSSGEEMTRDQIMALIAPPKEDHDAVVNWFRAHGTLKLFLSGDGPQSYLSGNVVAIQSFGDALKITAPSRVVEKMLKTRLYQYQHTRKTDIYAIRQVDGFTIPEDIADKIYMVTGLTMFPFVRKDLRTKLAMDEDDHGVLARSTR